MEEHILFDFRDPTMPCGFDVVAGKEVVEDQGTK